MPHLRLMEGFRERSGARRTARESRIFLHSRRCSPTSTPACTPTPRTSAAVSSCAGCCPRPRARRWGRSCSSTTSAPSTPAPTTTTTCAPHPHIGLATVTYLFEGAMMHRDSTGVVQRIEPGAINWMTAGRGIVHSERTPDDLRGVPRRSHGLQLWAALPAADEEMAPSFAHTPAAAIPALEVGGAQLRVLIGSAFGATSPVATRSRDAVPRHRAGRRRRLPAAAGARAGAVRRRAAASSSTAWPCRRSRWW